MKIKEKQIYNLKLVNFKNISHKKNNNLSDEMKPKIKVKTKCFKNDYQITVIENV